MSRRTSTAHRSLLLLVGTALLTGCAPSVEELEERWIARAGFDPRVTYPARESDRAALRFQEIAAELGIELELEQGTSVAFAQDSDPLSAGLWDEIRSFLEALRRPSAPLEPPSDELGAFLAECRPALQRLASLLEESPPAWRREVEDPRYPVYLGHLRIHRLFLATAVAAAAAGEHEAADDWLEVAARHRESFDDQPLLVDRIVAQAMLRSELRALLALPHVPPQSQRRLATLEPREEMETALRLETWIFRRGLAETLSAQGGWLQGRWGRYWARREAEHYMEAIERGLARLEEADLATFDAASLGQELVSATPRWYPVNRMLLPNFWDAAARARRTELEVELTRLAIELRQLLAAGDQAALDALPSHRPSSAHGIDWLYEITPGAVVVRASHELARPPDDPPLEIRLPLGS